jgi:hypothetical protein
LLQAPSAIEFVNDVLALDAVTCHKVVVLLWKLWDVRNKANAGDKALSDQEICGAVSCMVANFQTDNEQQIHRAAPQS